MLTERMSHVADLPALPRRLAAAEPGWTETTDVLVVGSGVAGLTAALHLREAGLHVTVVTKVNIDDGSTRWAQGGIAVALGPGDSPSQHAIDTLAASDGLADPEAVRILTSEGPDRIYELLALGARFDRGPEGRLRFGLEAAHTHPRIIHAGGDRTGAALISCLAELVRCHPDIELLEQVTGESFEDWKTYREGSSFESRRCAAKDSLRTG